MQFVVKSTNLATLIKRSVIKGEWNGDLIAEWETSKQRGMIVYDEDMEGYILVVHKDEVEPLVVAFYSLWDDVVDDTISHILNVAGSVDGEIKSKELEGGGIGIVVLSPNGEVLLNYYLYDDDLANEVVNIILQGGVDDEGD